jgi:hypothetical protein
MYPGKHLSQTCFFELVDLALEFLHFSSSSSASLPLTKSPPFSSS